jgi:hypothetical protein
MSTDCALLELRDVTGVCVEKADRTNAKRRASCREVENYDGRFYYHWREKNGKQLQRGKAFIFFSAAYVRSAEKMRKSFKYLGYDTIMATLSSSSIIKTLLSKG